LTLKVASLCAANEPITATVRSITWSVTVATVTARAARAGDGTPDALPSPPVPRLEQPSAANISPATSTSRQNNESHFIRFLSPYSKLGAAVSYDFNRRSRDMGRFEAVSASVRSNNS
jgi:hypothetical protein